MADKNTWMARRTRVSEIIEVGYDQDWPSRLYQTAFTSGMVGFLLQAMTDFSFYNYRVLFIFWAYLALGALSARRSGLPEGRLLA